MEVIVGTRGVLKFLSQGRVEKVFLASNAPSEIRDRVMEAAKQAQVEVVAFEGNELELGTKFGKPFPVACAAVLKSEEK